MRDWTKAELLFCKEYEKKHKALLPEVVEGVNVLLDKESFVCHARTKLAVIIVPAGTDICKAIRYLSMKGYYAIPFTEDEVMENASRAATEAVTALFPIIGDMEDYGLYCIDNAEKMDEVLRGAWQGWFR